MEIFKFLAQFLKNNLLIQLVCLKKYVDNLLLNLSYFLIFAGSKIMLAKVLMCTCYVEKFHAEDNEYVKRLVHFHCKWRDKHILYVLFYDKHPYGAPPIPQMEKSCMCATSVAQDVLAFCDQVEHLLNFRAYKLCMKRIPTSILDQIQTTGQYFKVLKGCHPFFNLKMKEIG